MVLKCFPNGYSISRRWYFFELVGPIALAARRVCVIERTSCQWTNQTHVDSAPRDAHTREVVRSCQMGRKKHTHTVSVPLPHSTASWQMENVCCSNIV